MKKKKGKSTKRAIQFIVHDEASYTKMLSL